MPLGKNRTNLKLATANVILVADAFVWYMLAFNCLKILLNQQNTTEFDLPIFGINTVAIAVSAFIATFFFQKLKDRRRFLYCWTASGIAISLVPLFLNTADISHIAIISLLFGTYFGLGMPATMGYHTILTKVEGRGKQGGLIFLIIGSTFAMTSVITQSSIFQIAIILAIIRVIGLISLHSIKPTELNKNQDEITSKVKYRKILFDRSFLFYFIPWGMFTLINYMTIPIQSTIYPLEPTNVMLSQSFLTELEYIISGLVAVLSGFVADRVGRKRLTMFGFIMLGIGYAVLGLVSANAGSSANLATSGSLLLASIVFTITDGIAWGIFYVVFLFTLWGDLAQSRNSDKFYFLGALPYMSSYFMQLLFAPYLTEISITTIFSFASVFLFLAVLPLVYAPETLPEKVMKDRDLKSYVEKAKKKAQKDTENVTKKENNPEQEPAESADNSKEYEEAKKLAEKYY
jgi:MFS family permease